MRTQSARNGDLTATCDSGYVPVGGGGTVANDTLDSSSLVDNRGNVLGTTSGQLPRHVVERQPDPQRQRVRHLHQMS